MVLLRVPTQIALFRGEIALVDEEDFPKVSGLNWYVGTNGYVMAWVSILRRPIYLHRVVMDAVPGERIDHWHHNKLDNRKEELRRVTQKQNVGNSRIQTRQKTSVFKGVCWNKQVGKWQSSIKKTLNGKKRTVYIGIFEKESDAAAAYNEAAVEHFGAEYALLNPILIYGQ